MIIGREAGPSPYTAVRLGRIHTKDEFERHFRAEWHTAVEISDPCRLFEEVRSSEEGEIWALWYTRIVPGWRTFADANLPVFVLIHCDRREALMLNDSYGSEIRDLSVNNGVTK